MTATLNTYEPLEFWMELKDRELLLELLDERGISRRQLATAAGWKSHTYLQRLLREGGPMTLETDPAIRIAYHLGVPVHRLFRTRASGDRARNASNGRAA